MSQIFPWHDLAFYAVINLSDSSSSGFCAERVFRLFSRVHTRVSRKGRRTYGNKSKIVLSTNVFLFIFKRFLFYVSRQCCKYAGSGRKKMKLPSANNEISYNLFVKRIQFFIFNLIRSATYLHLHLYTSDSISFHRFN